MCSSVRMVTVMIVGTIFKWGKENTNQQSHVWSSIACGEYCSTIIMVAKPLQYLVTQDHIPPFTSSLDRLSASKYNHIAKCPKIVAHHNEMPDGGYMACDTADPCGSINMPQKHLNTIDRSTIVHHQTQIDMGTMKTLEPLINIDKPQESHWVSLVDHPAYRRTWGSWEIVGGQGGVVGKQLTQHLHAKEQAWHVRNQIVDWCPPEN